MQIKIIKVSGRAWSRWPWESEGVWDAGVLFRIRGPPGSGQIVDENDAGRVLWCSAGFIVSVYILRAYL